MSLYLHAKQGCHYVDANTIKYFFDLVSLDFVYLDLDLDFLDEILSNWDLFTEFLTHTLKKILSQHLVNGELQFLKSSSRPTEMVSLIKNLTNHLMYLHYVMHRYNCVMVNRVKTKYKWCWGGSCPMFFFFSLKSNNRRYIVQYIHRTFCI